MNDDGAQPDAFEKRLRFGCGFAFGLVAGGVLVLEEVVSRLGVGVGIAVASGLLAGWLAMRFGDSFWSSMASWFRY